MITLTNVTWLYHQLPMRFSLEVTRGERIAILGPSGAGKSTLLNLVAGFLTPAEGTISLNGQEHTFTPPSVRPVSMLFQENNLFSHLTVKQNIALGIHPGMKLNAEQQDRLLLIAEKMGIQTMLDRLPAQLSGGQRQRVAIARALLLRPKLLLLDEPTSALDMSVQAEILNLLNHLKREHGMTYLLVSHDGDVIAHMSERAALMENGHIVQHYDRAALQAGEHMHD